MDIGERLLLSSLERYLMLIELLPYVDATNAFFAKREQDACSECECDVSSIHHYQIMENPTFVKNSVLGTNSN